MLVAICICLLCRTPASAVNLDRASEQGKSILKAAEQAELLPQSMEKQEANQPVTREQMCSLAVRLYASLTDTDYSELIRESTVRRKTCPYTDTKNKDVQQAWLLHLTEQTGTAFYPNKPANREQFIAILYRTLEESGSQVSLSPNEIAETIYTFKDSTDMPEWARQSMAYFIREGLSGGVGERMLGVGEQVSTEQAGILTYYAAAAVHTGRGISSAENISKISTHTGTQTVNWTSCGADYYLVYFYQTDSFDSAPVQIEQLTSEQNGTLELAVPQEILEQPGTWYWSVDGFDCTDKLLASSQQTAVLTVKTEEEIPEEQGGTLSIPSGSTPGIWLVPSAKNTGENTTNNTGSSDSEDLIAQTIPQGLAWYGESYSDKVTRIFGAGSSYHKYGSSSEAASHQTVISVQVWDFDKNGNKVTRTRRFSINSALASTVEQIFAEIYASDEQFPIYSLGGYNWRGDSSSSEHCLGTAIDINPDENYMCTNSGRALTGTHWSPGIDPYSISPNSDVVRIFAKYGFGWGGTWNSKKDYMHFSYFGR